MRRRISIRGRVRPSVRQSIFPCYFRRWKYAYYARLVPCIWPCFFLFLLLSSRYCDTFATKKIKALDLWMPACSFELSFVRTDSPDWTRKKFLYFFFLMTAAAIFWVENRVMLVYELRTYRFTDGQTNNPVYRDIRKLKRKFHGSS